MAALGDLLYRAALVWTRLAGNTTATKKFLRQTGTGAVSAAPAWDTLVAGDLPNTAVTPGSYTNTNLTVDAQGRLTAAANGSSGTGTVTTTGSPASGNLTKFSGATSITNADLTGDVTTSGTVAATIANSAVTLAKIANAAASSKLLGSGASGSGSPYAELTLGTNLTMSGTTLNAAAGSSGALTQLLQIVTAGSQATVDFTSISGSYSQLLVYWLAQDTQAGTSDTGVSLTINNDATSANYTSSARTGIVNGSANNTNVAPVSGAVQIGLMPQSGNTGIANAGQVFIPGYTQTTFHKRVVASMGGDDTSAGLFTLSYSFRWKSTAAITRLTFVAGGTAFTNGSIFTLYGVS